MTYKEPNDAGGDADQYNDKLFCDEDYKPLPMYRETDPDESMEDNFRAIAKEMDELAAKRAEPVPENLFAKAWRLNAMNEADAVLRNGLRSSYRLSYIMLGQTPPSDEAIDALIDNDMNQQQRVTK